MPRTIDCPICEGRDYRFACRDSGVDVVRCASCGFLYVNPQPASSELERIYACEYHRPDPAKQLTLDSHFRRPVFEHGIRMLRKLSSPGRLLDVGCGAAEFLALAHDAGWDTHGVDLVESTADYVRKGLVKLRLGTLRSSEYPGDYFDVVTLWDVLEHLPEPRVELDEIRRVLKPRGVLVVRVPNANFQLFKAWVRESVFGGSNDSLQADLHLNQFTSRSLRDVLQRCGFAVFHEEAGVSENVIFRRGVPLQFKKAFCGFARAAEGLAHVQIGPTVVQCARKTET